EAAATAPPATARRRRYASRACCRLLCWCSVEVTGQPVLSGCRVAVVLPAGRVAVCCVGVRLRSPASPSYLAAGVGGGFQSGLLPFAALVSGRSHRPRPTWPPGGGLSLPGNPVRAAGRSRQVGRAADLGQPLVGDLLQLTARPQFAERLVHAGDQ